MTNKYQELYGDQLRAEFTVWLNKSLTNAKCDYLRKKDREPKTTSLDSIPVDLIVDPHDCFAAVERSTADFEFEEAKLAYAFSKLPLMRREVLRLLFVEMKDPEEIASILRCSTSYVHLQKFRALKRLRELLAGSEDIYG